MAADQLKMAIYQGNGHTALPFKNIALLVELIQQAHEAGAKLLVCPELFISGYNISFEQTYGLAEVATGPAYQVVKDAAKRFSVAGFLSPTQLSV